MNFENRMEVLSSLDNRLLTKQIKHFTKMNERKNFACVFWFFIKDQNLQKIQRKGWKCSCWCFKLNPNEKCVKNGNLMFKLLAGVFVLLLNQTQKAYSRARLLGFRLRWSFPKILSIESEVFFFSILVFFIQWKFDKLH